MAKKIYVIAEHDNEKISSCTYEALGFAKLISKSKFIPIELIIIGYKGYRLSSMAESIAEKGFNVNAFEIKGMNYYNSEVYKHVLHSYFTCHKPAYICIPHTARSIDYAPGLGVRINSANISGVQGFEENKDTLIFFSAIDNGKKLSKIRPVTDTAILNIMPGIFKPVKEKSRVSGSVSVHNMEYLPENIHFKGVKKTKPDLKSDIKAISDAKVIVSVGNGIGDGEHLNLIYKMADLFHNSAVAGSRIVCDKGLLAYSQQVGITGTIVLPGLYIACGISGSSQHLAGMSGSEFIVSINTDPKAPIMNSADVCIVEDMTKFIPAFIDVFNKQPDNQAVL